MLSVSFSFFCWQQDRFCWYFFNQCLRIVSLSLFKYFEPVKDETKGKCCDAISIALSLSNKDKNAISGADSGLANLVKMTNFFFNN